MQIKINKIFDYAANVSGLILFSLAILTFCDVFGRRFLNLAEFLIQDFPLKLFGVVYLALYGL